MKSNYKPIGEYIRLVDVRNIGLKVTTLLGLSISKEFIPSVANTIGSDMENYKIIRRNQFACSLMQVRRDKKIPVALLHDFKEAIISQAYPVFEVLDENVLLPEYLMMWFCRSEFDRESCFYAVGGVRGSLEWEDFCNMQLPITSLDKQKEIVAEYNTIVNRIKLNEQLNQKLEETAQAIYKQWFVDFEFQDENGNTYKSSGGEMDVHTAFENGLPKGFKYCQIQDLIDGGVIYNNQDGNHGEIHPKGNDFVSSGIPFIMANDINNGVLDLAHCKHITKTQAAKLRVGFAKNDDVLMTHKGTMGRIAIVESIEDFIVLTPQVTLYRVKNKDAINKEFLYCLFCSESFQQVLQSDSDQSTRKFLSITNQRLLRIVLPTPRIIQKFENIVGPILRHRRICAREMLQLHSLLDNLTAKLAKGTL